MLLESRSLTTLSSLTHSTGEMEENLPAVETRHTLSQYLPGVCRHVKFAFARHIINGFVCLEPPTPLFFFFFLVAIVYIPQGGNILLSPLSSQHPARSVPLTPINVDEIWEREGMSSFVRTPRSSRPRRQGALGFPAGPGET